MDHFHYKEAHLCQNTRITNIIELLKEGKLVVEPRCYIDMSNNKLRDRGVAWRLQGKYLKELYADVIKIL